MGESVEQIEARLCAYVDGELSPSECAQIERHLAENPAHQALVQDLIRQRMMLSNLPRERAAADLTEEIQSQLEREALLQEQPGQEIVLRISPWPRILAAAAMLLVASGLGVVIYSVLPPRHPALSMAPQPAPMRPEGVVAADGVEERALAPSDESMRRLARPSPDAASRSPLALADARDNKAGGESAASAELDADAYSDAIVITVRADDLERANQDVVRYLASRQIAYSATDEMKADEMVFEGVAGVERAPSPVQSVVGAIDTPAVGESQRQLLEAPARGTVAKELTGGREIAPAEAPTTAPAVAVLPGAGITERDSEQLGQVKQPPPPLRIALGGTDATDRVGKAADRMSQPTTAPATPAISGMGFAGGGRAVRSIARRAGGPPDSGGAVGNGSDLRAQSMFGGGRLAAVKMRDLNLGLAAGERLILVRNINERQIVQLTEALSDPQRNQTATIALDRQKRLSILGAHRRAYGRMQTAEQWNALPTTAPAQIAGGAYASTERGEPTTRPFSNITPATVGISLRDVPQTQPASGFLWANGDRPVNCVIVLRNNVSAAAVASPTTQPAMGKASASPAERSTEVQRSQTTDTSQK